MATAPQPMTLEQFIKLPEAEPALEFHDGVVTRKTSPLGPHGTLQGEYYFLFELFGRPRRACRAFTETRITISGSSFVPDVIVYRWERVPADDLGDVPDYFTEPPDIAIEIASPGQSLQDLADKCRWCVEHGVRVSLLANARTRAVRVFRPGQRDAVFRGAARIDLGDAIPGFELDLAELFGWLKSRPD